MKPYIQKIEGHIIKKNGVKYKILARKKDGITYENLKRAREHTKNMYPRHSVILMKWGKTHILIISLEESPYRRFRTWS